MRPSPFQRNATRTPLQHCGTLRYAGCAYLQVCSGRDITVVAEATKKTYVIQWEKWSERGDLNSRPPVPQTGAAKSAFIFYLNMLADIAVIIVGLFAGLLVRVYDRKGVCDLIIERVSVSGRRLDVRVIERLLHKLEVTGLTEKLRPKIMPKIVKAKALDASPSPKSPPLRLNA